MLCTDICVNLKCSIISFQLNREILMKSFVPQKSDEIFTNHDRKLAPAGLIQMFIEREENARRLETKTGKGLSSIRMSRGNQGGIL